MDIKTCKEKYEKWYKTHPISVIMKRIVGLILFTTAINVRVFGEDVLAWYWDLFCVLVGILGASMLDIFRWER